uniref:Uncharacterized protein n=1 Tax=Rhizophora mucronata TaxID=61149 RepID=A0A2P2R0L0_RHIMU
MRRIWRRDLLSEHEIH